MATQITTETRNHNEYTVGWVCALPKEQTAATAMLDQRHADLPKPSNDPNTYTLGSFGSHNVVIACLPKGQIGNNTAATVAAFMVSTFPSIKFGLMVGVGGGIPPKVRLGDVVVSTPVGQFSGVVQWDFGKAEEGGSFKRTGSLNNPPISLLTALTKLETEHEMKGSRIQEYLDELKQKWPKLEPKYLRSDSLKDVLFKASYGHVTESTDGGAISGRGDEEEGEGSCRFCDRTQIVRRKPRDMRVHYGLIASGNQVIKDGTIRDRLTKDLGVCDVVSTIRENAMHTQAQLNKKEDAEILDWLTPVDYGRQQSDYFGNRQQGTGQWFLESAEYQEWLDADGKTLFCPGIQGAGKTILSSIVINNLHTRLSENHNIGVAYIYCNFRQEQEQKINDLLASLVKQLSRGWHSLPESVNSLYGKHKKNATRPLVEELSATLQYVIELYTKVFIIVDALDECQALDDCRGKLLSEILRYQDRTAVNFFATSRPIPDITKIFQHTLCLEIRATKDDVTLYLEKHIGTLRPVIETNSRLQEQIKIGISDAVDGMFLLAHIYLHFFMDKVTENDVRSALKEIQKQKQAYGDEFGQTALSWAAERGQEARVKLLLNSSGVDVDSEDEFGRTPLCLAVEKGHNAIVRMLLDTGNVDVNARDVDSDQTIFSWAAMRGREFVVRMLLRTGKVDVDTRDIHFSRTPLLWAAMYGHKAIIELLLSLGGAEPDAQDSTGRTPLSLAAEEGHEGIVHLLLNTRKVNVAARDNIFGQTPLDMAIKRRHEAIKRGHEAIIDMLHHHSSS
ncbi:Ankyrin repeat [Fusarium oxysporum f. sp. vasinfectum]|nr:Ankyrin repeat [Fusarium oxysporum f. sp. vasinfectum]